MLLTSVIKELPGLVGSGTSYTYIYMYIRDVESAMVTTLFFVSSVGSSTRWLELSLKVALESVGRSVLG
jgi:hypothetical protein